MGGFYAILWIDGTAKTTIEQSFMDIARSVIGDSVNVEPGRLPSLVLAQIRTWREPWLPVFDNFDDPSVYNINQYLPPSDYGFMIITGRHPAANALGSSISIGDLLECEAVDMLFHRIKREKSK
ncbi:hypothetical protein NHQ30_007227 [Ciborinia camelliae]|nr:hypothetical protein NHQ30_007227 [Ciborinia camelliae]